MNNLSENKIIGNIKMDLRTFLERRAIERTFNFNFRQIRNAIRNRTYIGLFDELNNYRGINVTIRFGNGETNTLFIPISNQEFRAFRSRYDSIFYYSLLQSNNIYTIIPDLTITPNMSQQVFRDNTLSNCMFEPILEFFKQKVETSKSKVSINKYKALVNKVNKYQNKYQNGLPEDKIQEYSDLIKCNISIKSINSKDNLIYVMPNNKPLTSFTFLNTRDDHVELWGNGKIKNDLFCNMKNIKVNHIEPVYENNKIKKVYCDDKEITDIVLYKTKGDEITQIITKEGKYTKINQFQDMLKEYNKIFNGMFICDINQPELSKYIRSGLITCGTIDFKFFGQDFTIDEENPFELLPKINCKKEELKHIDMIKSYTQGKACNYYEGYPAKITDFRKTNKIEGIGYYEIINFKGNEFLTKLGYKSGVYPSVELKFLKDQGCTFDIVSGCWGSSFDFEYKEDSYKKIDNIPFYSYHFGCSIIESYTTRWAINSDQVEKLANHNDIIKSDNVNYLILKKEFNHHLSHFCGFITAYMRINMLNQINKMDKSKIVRVCVDGIYYEDHDFELDTIFQYKTKLKLGNCAGDYFFQAGPSNIIPNAEPRTHNLRELHKGPGGSGKTYKNLNDKGLVKPLYIAHSHKLKSCMINKYNTSGEVFHTLESKDPYNIMKINNYNTLIIDECSMISNEFKNYIVTTFPYHKLIFMGDPGYQLPPYDNNISMNDIGLYKIEYKQNYRTNDPSLLKILHDIRYCIDNNEFYNYEFPISNTDEYNHKEDIILTFTNDTKDKYTDRFKHLEKYRIYKNTRDYKNGDIVFEKGPHRNLQHGFTTHSIQGETYEGKIFIDKEIIYKQDLKLLYTAISRAKYLNQIKII